MIVLGGGGHAKVVVATARAAGWEVCAVFDDDRDCWGSTVLGVPVAGALDSARGDDRPAIVAVGDNSTRSRLASSFDLPWATIVHPRAIVHSSVGLASGAVVFAGAVVQPDVAIGAHAIINTAAVVDHDCRIDEFAHVAPGAVLAGGVEIGAGSLVGAGACILPAVSVGAGSTIGAGSVVVADVGAETTVAGSPARPLS